MKKSDKGCGISSHYILKKQGDQDQIVGRISGGFLGTLVALAPMITAGIHGISSIVNNSIKAKHGKGVYSLASTKDGSRPEWFVSRDKIDKSHKFKIHRPLRRKHISHAKGMFGEGSIHENAIFKAKTNKKKKKTTKVTGNSIGFGTLGKTGQILYD